MKRFIPICFWLLSICAAFSALQTAIDFDFSFNSSNAVQVIWNAYPGKSYVLQTTTNLAGPWSSSSTLVATSNSLAFSFPTAAKARCSNLSFQLSDATGINTNSIRLTVGSLDTFTLTNAQLTFSNNLLTLLNGGSIPPNRFAES